MTKGVRSTVLLLLVVILGVVALTVLKRGDGIVELDRDALRDKGVVYFDTPRSFKFMPLIRQDNSPYTESSLKDHWTLMYFGFTFCPDICPATLSQLNTMMIELQAKAPEIADKLDVVMVSVDPGRDSPEKLAQYVPYFNEAFYGVTGDPNVLAGLARQLNVAFEFVGDTTSDDYLVEHSAQVVLVNPMGDYQGFLKSPMKPKDQAEALIDIVKAF
ncbi:SCO family protein [Sansalvadorimonas sp. 2012CJ34-2]|uniref:SCO family protein n=1 Tax=Parendozoicomonas callyspongiae TaxID=2942213 RepID=A0ABT0PAR5_9GAMM|nr:SCO family protein [Sansalvadorimonas sp. 2012CJ34-2]MCL6268482.1 SCO family protein [Sansalvadorimonas sp. 2012CJ34-2]